MASAPLDIVFGVSTFGYRGILSRWMLTVGGRWVVASEPELSERCWESLDVFDSCGNNFDFSRDGRKGEDTIVERLTSEIRSLLVWPFLFYLQPFLAFNLFRPPFKSLSQTFHECVSWNLHNSIRNWVKYLGQKASILMLMLWNLESNEKRISTRLRTHSTYKLY